MDFGTKSLKSKSLTSSNLIVPAAAFNTIFDKVKNMLLQWALKLEDEEIIGEDMKFNEDDKEKAQAATQPVYNN